MHNQFLNNPLEQIILETIDGVKQYLAIKEEKENYDDDYHNARKFMSEYRHCLWHGETTPTFLEEFKQYTLALFKTEKIQKANNFLITSMAGMATSFIGVYMQSQMVTTAGTILAGIGLIMGYLTARNIREQLNYLKNAVNNPEEINQALKKLYKQGK